MVRNVRLEYGGAFYHIRGQNRGQSTYPDKKALRPQLRAEKLLGLLESGSQRSLDRTYLSASQYRAHGQLQAETLLANALRRATFERGSRLPAESRCA